MSNLVRDLQSNLKWLKSNNLFHNDPIIEQLADPVIIIGKKKLICFCSNNYLGLSKRKEILRASKDALMKYGIGTCESRKLGGNLKLLEELETTLSKFKGTEDTMIFATGLLANVGVISAICDSNFYMSHFYHHNVRVKNPSVILGDQFNHRSIQMGVKLSKATHYKYKHNNMVELEALLNMNKNKNILIVTAGVFSMQGDLASLDKIVKLANFYKASIMVDDAHGTGVFGPNGRGTSEHFNLSDKIDFNMGTLSKAFGGLGGFVSSKKEIIEMLKTSTSTYYFTSSLPAEQAAGLIASIKIVQSEKNLRYQLWRNVFKLIKGFFNIGIDFPLRWSHIIPIEVGDEKKALSVEKYLYQKGILCSAVTVPAVAPGKAIIRCSVNATHTNEHIEIFLSILNEVARKFDLKTNKYNQNDFNNFLDSAPEYIKKMLD